MRRASIVRLLIAAEAILIGAAANLPQAIASPLLNPFSTAEIGPTAGLVVTSGTVDIFTGSAYGDSSYLAPTITFNGQTFAGIVLNQGFVDNGTYQDSISSYTGPISTGAPQIAKFDFSRISIGAGVSVNVTGFNGLALLSRGSATIDSAISVNGGHGSYQTPGLGVAGGFNGGSPSSPVGEGPGAGGAQGGGGGFGGSGAFSYTVGTTPETSTTYGGMYANDAAGLYTSKALYAGSGGGAGLQTSTSGVGGGGAGGGALEIDAISRLSIDAPITADGGNGSIDVNGGGGGGSGGGIRISAAQIVLGTGGSVTANGGNSQEAGGGGGGQVLLQSTNASDFAGYGQSPTQPMTVAGGTGPGPGGYGRNGILAAVPVAIASSTNSLAFNTIAPLTYKTLAVGMVPQAQSNELGTLNGEVTGITGPNASEFQLIDPSTSGAVNALPFAFTGTQPYYVFVRFDPNTVGEAQATLNYVSDAGSGSVSLVGYGAAVPEPGSLLLLGWGAVAAIAIKKKNRKIGVRM